MRTCRGGAEEAVGRALYRATSEVSEKLAASRVCEVGCFVLGTGGGGGGRTRRERRSRA